jgi:threonine synthase
MRFRSTRGTCPEIGFREAVLSGLAPDGGLYMPERWPSFGGVSALEGLSFAGAAARILVQFAGDEIAESALLKIAEQAYAAFDARDVAPLRHIERDVHILELFHGPTLAFKDIAMRMLAGLYDWALDGDSAGVTIIGATSGDTGGAAIDAFARSTRAEVLMLHPKGRVSDVQRRMMTTTGAPNIINIAIAGTFDDCQRIVKTLFADPTLKADLRLGGVNSINWIRLATQTVYYATALEAQAAPASFIVPTGNFGDAFAGYCAKQMGFPVAKVGVATNTNDIMRRVLETGRYAPRGVTPTTSPSMDIEVASNFERLLFEASRRDTTAIARLMDEFAARGEFLLPAAWRAKMAADFLAASASESEVAGMIAARYRLDGVIVDPHTAVGLVAEAKLRRAGKLDGPAICLATAHPAKFPDAVEAACGVKPGLPERLTGLLSRKEEMIEAPASHEAVRKILLDRARLGLRRRVS